jgi:hypothetical protein
MASPFITRGSAAYNAASPYVDPASGYSSNPYDNQLTNVSLTQYEPDFWASLGFQGEPYMDGENGRSLSPALTQFIEGRGIQPGVTDWNQGQHQAGLFEANSQTPLAGSQYTNAPNDNAFWNAALAAGAITGANMLDAGMFGGAAGNAAGGAEGLTFAGNTAGYGGAGALGSPSLLTGGTLGTVGEGLSYGAMGGLGAAGAVGAAGPSMAAGSTSAAGPVGSGLLNTLTSNPRLAGALVGGLLGGSGGGSSGGGAAPYTGPMPTITRGDFNPNPQATQMQVPQFGQGLFSGQGTPNAGLWRFKG